MRLALLVPLLALLALLASCGGGGGTPTATRSSILPTTDASAPTARPTLEPLDELARMVFVDRLRGWALTTCNNALPPCRIVATDDGGRTWREQYAARNGERLQDIRAFSVDRAVVVSHDAATAEPTLVVTNDGGASWERRAPSGLTEAHSVHVATPDVAFVLAPAGMFRTDDAGRTWNQVSSLSDRCRVGDFDFPTTELGWAAGTGEVGPCLIRSTDGGQTWSLVFDGVTSPPVEAAFRRFLTSRNSTFEEMARLANDQCRGSRVRFVEPETGWLVVGCRAYFSGGFAVLRTTDGGASWQYTWGPQSCIMGCQSITGGMAPLFFLDAQHVWRQGRMMIELSVDGGGTWSGPKELGECCHALLYDSVFFVDETHGWLMTAQGEIGITEDGGETWEFRPVAIASE